MSATIKDGYDGIGGREYLGYLPVSAHGQYRISSRRTAR